MTTKSLPIGARSRRFVLEVPRETPDGFRGVIRSYVAGPQLWGAMEMLAGAERRRANRPEEAVTHRVTFRYRAGVTAAIFRATPPPWRPSTGASPKSRPP